jgi:hypothetical protein
MIGARALAAFVALAAGGGLARQASAEPPTLAAKAGASLPETYPLVFLFQGDAVVDSAPSGPGADDPTGGSHLRVRRLRFGDDVLSGAWRLRALLEASSRDEAFAPTEGGRIPIARYVRVTEAFAAWRPHRAFELDAGATRVPFSLSRQVDEPDLRLPERAQAVVALAPDYRTGLALASDLGALNLRLAGMSADTSLDDRLFTSGFFGALRLGADPIGPMGVAPWRRGADDPWAGWWRFSAGVSVLYGTLLAPRTLAFGGDLQLQWRRVTVSGEYLAHHLATGPGPLPSQGAVLEPGVFIIRDRLELVLRGAWVHQPLAPTADAPGVASGAADTLAGGGALTFFLRDARLRLQAGAELRRTLDARLPSSGWAIMRATFVL